MKMPKMTCKEFDEGLREATKKHRGIENDAEIRPFVCDGSPLDCNVFIVGFNPASAIPFWDCWDSKLCYFDYKKWEMTYAAKKRLSPTRRNIKKFSEVLRKKKFQCLETNIYSYSSPTMKSLAPELQTAKHTLEFLIEALNPTAILFHGKKARMEGELLKQQKGFSFGSQSCRHFSRGWSYEAVEKLADDVFTDMCVFKR